MTTRRLFALFMLPLVVLIVATLAAFAGAASATQPDPEHKVGLCHRTASDTNPYVYIEVDEAAVPAHVGNTLPGHKPTVWKTDGTFRGVSHAAGDPKDDYLAQSPGDCDDLVVDPTPTPTDPTPTPTEPTPTPTVTDPTPTPTHTTEEPTEKPTPTKDPGDKPDKQDPPKQDKPGKTPDTLPHTGGISWPYLGGALALILAGAAAIAWSGRRA